MNKLDEVLSWIKDIAKKGQENIEVSSANEKTHDQAMAAIDQSFEKFGM